MPNQRPKFINDEVYHISSRTVGDTVIFKNEDDFYRGIFSIYEFNNKDPVEIWRKRRDRIIFKKHQKSDEFVGRPTSHKLDTRDKLVEVWVFSFMPNHFHLIVKQLKDNGIVEFMKKVNGGLAKYFNDKYKRIGHLFNKFYPVHIKSDEQLKTAFTYVHTNLISLIEPGWKERGVKNPEKVKRFLENHKKHSYLDYLGKKNFPSVTEREFLLEIMGGPRGCKAAVDNWIMHKKEVKDFNDIYWQSLGGRRTSP